MAKDRMIPAPQSITVFFNRVEGWINVLTCAVGAEVLPISAQIEPYNEARAEYWRLRAQNEPSSVYAFNATRIAID